ASAPMARLDSVTPIWLAESMRGRFSAARKARRAFQSPRRANSSSRERRERMRANSAATKNPFRNRRIAMTARRPSMAISYGASGPRSSRPLRARHSSSILPVTPRVGLHNLRASMAHDHAHSGAHDHDHDHAHLASDARHAHG